MTKPRLVGWSVAIVATLIALRSLTAERSPAGTYVNNDELADTLRIYPDSTFKRTGHPTGRIHDSTVVPSGYWFLDEDGRHVWLAGAGLTIERDWRGRFARIYYRADEYAAYVRVE
jgi:hypothetical protein